MEQWRDRDRRPEHGPLARVARPDPEPVKRSTSSPPEQAAEPGLPGAQVSPDDPAPMRRELRRALSSRDTLRQAILLHEILGPPKALQPAAGEIIQPPPARTWPKEV